MISPANHSGAYNADGQSKPQEGRAAQGNIPVCTECGEACLTITEVDNPDGRCWGCRENERRGLAA